MLNLTRKMGESIRIGNTVTVVVKGIRGDKVMLAVDAPRSITVHRSEVYDKIAAQDQLAIDQAIDEGE